MSRGIFNTVANTQPTLSLQTLAELRGNLQLITNLHASLTAASTLSIDAAINNFPHGSHSLGPLLSDLVDAALKDSPKITSRRSVHSVSTEISIQNIDFSIPSFPLKNNKRGLNDWETKLFYKGLRDFGSDLSCIREAYLHHRTYQDVYRAFVKENKHNSWMIDAALLLNRKRKGFIRESREGLESKKEPIEQVEIVGTPLKKEQQIERIDTRLKCARKETEHEIICCEDCLGKRVFPSLDEI